MILNQTMTNELPNIEDIIIKPEDILREVTEIVQQYKMNYLEATAYFCEKNNYDTTSISKIIPQSLRALIEQSAKDLKLLKKKYNNSNTLPL
jgi:hypothetical protein